MKTKKKHYLPLLSLILVFTLVFFGCMMASCSDGKPDDKNPDLPDDPQNTVSAENSIFLVDGEACAYQIIRSDYTSSSSAETTASLKIQQAIQAMIGVKPEIGTDYDYGDLNLGLVKQDCEILIGNTNREESATALAALGDHDYGIFVIGSKICLVAANDRALSCATDDFLTNYLKIAEKILYIPKELNVLGTAYIAEGTYFEVKSSIKSGADKYDESLALACLQGIMNRESPARVYVNSGGGNDTWLETMQEEGRWLHDVEFEQISGFEELMEIGGAAYVKAVCIWDEDVPATVNVATTVAGVEDGLAMTWTAYQKYQHLLSDDVKVINLIGMFDGSVTGSAKNDAYLWAIENYLEKGLCSTDVLAHYMDAWNSSGISGRRDAGDDSYVCVRDWAVYHRSFVIDLSPWSDEAPFDDLTQEVGTDYKTFTRVLEYMYEHTKDDTPFEMCGFFDFAKYSLSGANTISKHDTVPAEWEYVWLVSAYNGYHNTCIEWSWNESFHTQYTGAQQLTNNRPTDMLELESDTTYLCFFMADYDSTYPLYRFLQDYWADPRRGEIPLAWGINPNLLDHYPDIIEYYYETATENDYFTSDASCAGYINPSRVPDETWDIMIEHNLKYFQRADMTIAPMVLDQDRLDEQSLEAFYQFAPDGLATIIIDQHGEGGSQAPAGMYESMPTDRLDNSYSGTLSSLESIVNYGYKRTLGKTKSGSSLSLIRCVWTTPSAICEVVDQYRAAHPDENVVVVDIYNYFNLLAQDLDN